MRGETRVAVSADDRNGLDSVVSPHFGRCPYFILVDLDDCDVQQVTAVENPYYGRHQPGQVPQFIRQQGAGVMLTGGMGRRAIGFFEQYGIQAVTEASGTVRHSLERYLGGELQSAEPCRESIEHAHEHEGATESMEYEEDEVGRLREEAEMLQRQFDEVMARLKKLSEGPQRG
ncbi:MAG: NifB/NifX family molybdenum-iron cluster-binding protein [Chloroflexota bacterium]|nr:NifB/NifX family molybdenum-iron cluster-binding protein [Chloroflexota bacterium]